VAAVVAPLCIGGSSRNLKKMFQRKQSYLLERFTGHLSFTSEVLIGQDQQSGDDREDGSESENNQVS
jgi:hypothetical protein